MPFLLVVLASGKKVMVETESEEMAKVIALSKHGNASTEDRVLRVVSMRPVPTI